MTRHHAGDTVRGGYYWNIAGWDATFVEGKEGALPGDAQATYVRVPALLLLGAAPVLGGLLVVFLPFIGIALFVQHVGRAAVEAGAQAVERVLPARKATVAFGHTATRVSRTPAEKVEGSSRPGTR
jgi:hypothetical protein